MSFRALVTDKGADGKVASGITELDEGRLPQGNVMVGIDWAGFNYKDGMALSGIGGLVRDYPHVGGVDFAGRVIESTDERYHPGQAVVLTGWRVGEWHWGGFATRARVDADWLVPLPKEMSTRDAMVLGTAGDGDILVTGAGGGVGSMAVLLLARLGYKVHAMTGRAELTDELKALGATEVVGRDALAPTGKKLLATRWIGAVDSVGGAPLGEMLKQIHTGGCVAAVGLSAGDGITLAGIDSVMQPFEARMAAWDRLSTLFGFGVYERMVREAGLGDLVEISKDILAGKVRGRVIVSPKG